MENDLLERKDCEIATLNEKMVKITKENEQLKKAMAELNNDIIEANN